MSQHRSTSRHSREETYNRDGNWVREFFARSEPWPIVEQWAADRGYHLIAMKGKRRLYQKSVSASFYSALVDIKERDGHLVVVAWIQVGFWARALTLFWHPSLFPIEPSGFRGIWKRREACRDLNQLLSRFRQPEIVGSHGLHFADVDPSTAILLASLLVPIAIYCALAGKQIELGPGISNGLLSALASRLQPLFITTGILLVAHHFIIKKFATWVAKGISLGISLLVVTVLSIVLLTRTSTEMAMQKVSYHCLFRYQEAKCREALAVMSPKQREQFGARVQQLEQHLGIAVAVPTTPTPPKSFY